MKPDFSLILSCLISYLEFLALLYNTAEQSYCHGTGVRNLSSSVGRTSFPETVKRINAKFGGKVPTQHISMQCCCFFCFFQFLQFCFVRCLYDFPLFSLTWGHSGRKIFQATSPKTHAFS